MHVIMTFGYIVFPLPKKTLSNQFNNMTMTVEVKLASALNLTYIKVDNSAALKK